MILANQSTVSGQSRPMRGLHSGPGHSQSVREQQESYARYLNASFQAGLTETARERTERTNITTGPRLSELDRARLGLAAVGKVGNIFSRILLKYFCHFRNPRGGQSTSLDLATTLGIFTRHLIPSTGSKFKLFYTED